MYRRRDNLVAIKKKEKASLSHNLFFKDLRCAVSHSLALRESSLLGSPSTKESITVNPGLGTNVIEDT